jgi:hypothetical protein
MIRSVPLIWAPNRRIKNEPQLQQVAKLTSSNDEYISSFLVPPWRRTQRGFNGRLTYPMPIEEEKEEAKERRTQLALGDKREVFGRLLQCRTGHGYTGEFYSRFVPDENVDCLCGEPLQTREHII